MSTTTDHPHVLVLPPLLYTGTLGVALLLHWLKPWYLPNGWRVRITGIVLIVAAAALGIWGERTLKRAGTNVNPREPTLAIVSDGPYRFTRNPLYVALIGLYLGITLAVGTAWPLVFLIPVLLITHYGIIKREERYLVGKFAEPYVAYMKSVRRWI
jgi:protein-S-isoprenylcysteine O-methyltransferase Ste14